jgi:hypothetical protein
MTSQTIKGVEEQYRQTQSFKVEYRIIRTDGELRWVYTRGYPIYDSQGRHYRMVGTTEDITARKAIEDALQESERRYRDLIELQKEGILIITPAVRSPTPTLPLKRSSCATSRSCPGAPSPNCWTNPPASGCSPHLPAPRTRWRSLTIPTRTTNAACCSPSRRSTADRTPFRRHRDLPDITRRKQTEDELLYISMHDPLTNIYNRAFFERELARLECEPSTH